MPERGCGRRIKGQVYLELKAGAGGLPWQTFIKDPPVPLDQAQWHLTELGVRLYEQNGAIHVIDWVGARWYAKPALFVDEFRQHGLSRRISKSIDFSKLSRRSRLLLVHAQAYWSNYADWYTILQQEGAALSCPKARPDHPLHPGPGQPMCAQLWWHDLPGLVGPAEPRRSAKIANEDRLGQRAVSIARPGGVCTRGFRTPRGVQPLYLSPAIFMECPVGQITVVDDPADRSSVRYLADRIAEQSSAIPVLVEEE